MNPPVFSIVIPSFNQARFLAQCVDSVLAQDGVELEVLVVDGGSDDGSTDVIERYADRLHWWCSEPDGGQSDAINKGMRHASGDVLGWLNSDDFFYPGALARIAEARAAHPDAGLFAGNGWRVDVEGERTARFAEAPFRVDWRALAYGIDYLLQPCTLFSRAAWQHVGGLRTDLHWSMDWDLWLRILRDFDGVAVDADIAASREYAGTKTASGAFPRWQELRALVEEHTGMPITPGTLAYFLHTLHDFLQVDERATELFSGLRTPVVRLWDVVNKAGLLRLTGRENGFPPVTAGARDDAAVAHSIDAADSALADACAESLADARAALAGVDEPLRSRIARALDVQARLLAALHEPGRTAETARGWRSWFQR